MKKIFLKEAAYLLLLSGGCVGILEALDPFGNRALYKEEEIEIGENDTLKDGLITDTWLKKGKEIPYYKIQKFKELPSSVKNNPLHRDIQRASDIENNITKIYCSNRMFANQISWETKGREGKNIKQEIAPRRGTIQGGCLSVLWHRTHYKKNKWKGSWKLIWILRDREFATMFVSTLITENGKMKVDGNAYVMRENTTSKKWKILGWYGTKYRKEISSSNREKLIPLPGPMVNKAVKNWGFSFEDKNICKDEDPDCKVSRGHTYANQNWTLIPGKVSPITKQIYSVTEWNINDKYWSEKRSLFPHNLTKSYENIKGYYDLVETDMIKWS